MRDHHALGIRRGAAGVVERDHLALVDLRGFESGGGRGESGLVVQPAVLRAFEGDEVLHVGHLRADAVHGVEVVGMHADHARAAVLENIGEVVRGEAEVDGHDHGADLRHRVEGLQMRVGVRRDGGHAVARLHAQLLQGGGPAVAALKELAVGEAASPSTTASRSA